MVIKSFLIKNAEKHLKIYLLFRNFIKKIPKRSKQLKKLIPLFLAYAKYSPQFFKQDIKLISDCTQIAKKKTIQFFTQTAKNLSIFQSE